MAAARMSKWEVSSDRVTEGWLGVSEGRGHGQPTSSRRAASVVMLVTQRSPGFHLASAGLRFFRNSRNLYTFELHSSHTSASRRASLRNLILCCHSPYTLSNTGRAVVARSAPDCVRLGAFGRYGARGPGENCRYCPTVAGPQLRPIRTIQASDDWPDRERCRCLDVAEDRNVCSGRLLPRCHAGAGVVQGGCRQ